MPTSPWSPHAIDRHASGANRPVRRGAGAAAATLAVWAAAGTALGMLAVFVDTDLDTAGLALGAGITVVVVTAALLAAGFGGSGTRALAWLVAGTAGTAAGAGLAPAQLVQAGVSTSVIVGAVALVSGLVLLGLGLAALLRALDGWWRVLALPVAFAVLQLGVLPLTMAVIGTHPVREPFTTTVPEGAQRVTLAAADGVPLVGWYTPSRNRAAVVLLHGAGGSKADTREHAAVLAQGGYGVLALDARGGGESGGRGMLWGWHGATDVAAAVDWLAARPDVDPARIGLVGESMGGEQAITGAAADPRVRAVVAEGASARVAGDEDFLPLDVPGLIQRAYYPVMWGAADLMTGASAPAPLTELVTRLGDRHILLISSDDPHDKAAGPRIRDAAPDTVELWEPADTGHTQALARHREEWIRRVLAFLDEALRGG
jgi:dienelactone hydrolase